MKVVLPDQVAAEADAMFVLEIEFPDPRPDTEKVEVTTIGDIEALDLRGTGAGGLYEVHTGLQALHVPLRVSDAKEGEATVKVDWTDHNGTVHSAERSVRITKPAAAAASSGSGAKLAVVGVLLAGLTALGIFVVPGLFGGGKVPDVGGKQLAAAVSELEEAGYEVVVEKVPVDMETKNGLVLRTEPAAGTKRGKGATVHVQVGSVLVELVSTVGYLEEEAVGAITAMGLHPLLQYADADGPSDVGKVIEQSPTEGDSLHFGGSVKLLIGRKPSGGFGTPAGPDNPTDPETDVPSVPGTGDTPSGEMPPVDLPSGDNPAGDAPTGDNPTGDNPTGDAPTGDNPTGDTPTGDNPSGDMPTGDNPTGDTPTGDNPTADTPTGETPSTDIAGPDAPGGDTPGSDTPGSDAPGGDTPSTEGPTVQTVELAGMVGTAVGDAERGLIAQGVRVLIRYEWAKTEAEVDKVLGQSPAKAAQVERGSVVELTVGRMPVGGFNAPLPEVTKGTVPEVVGRQRMVAETLIQRAGLRYRVRLEETANEPAGSVLRQEPAAGTAVDSGSRVTLVVARPPEAKGIEVPNVVGKTEAEAAKILRAAGFLVRSEDADGSGTTRGAVVAQDPPARAEAPRRTWVIISVAR